VRAYLAILALAALAWPCRADTISFSDAQFANGDWTHVEEADTGGNASLTVAQIVNGGNPDAYQRGTHTWTGAGGVVYVHLFDPSGGATVDPALGAINAVDFSFDARVFLPTTFDVAVGFRFAIEQDGTYYINDQALVTFLSEGWETHSLSGLTASNFLALNGMGGVTAGANPDFSAGGGAIRFGYVTTNSVGAAFELEWGVDNWSVTVDTDATTGPVPEPGTLALLGASLLIGYGAYRRRRREVP